MYIQLLLPNSASRNSLIYIVFFCSSYFAGFLQLTSCYWFRWEWCHNWTSHTKDCHPCWYHYGLRVAYIGTLGFLEYLHSKNESSFVYLKNEAACKDTAEESIVCGTAKAIVKDMWVCTQNPIFIYLSSQSDVRVKLRQHPRSKWG